MSKLHRIQIHARQPSKANPHPLVVLFVGDSGDLGVWTRTMAHRGIHGTALATRPMDNQEAANTDACWRLRWLKYMTWDALIEDEYSVTGDAVWTQRLLTIAGGSRSVADIKAAVLKWRPGAIFKSNLVIAHKSKNL